MKKFLFIAPVIFIIFMQLSAVRAKAAAYDIGFETLAGTETADEFNKYKDEFFEIVTKDMSPGMKKQINVNDIDFNNENIVKGFKQNYGTDILAGMNSIEQIKRSEEESMKFTGLSADPDGFTNNSTYCWKVFITIGGTAIYAEIFPDDENAAIDSFGKDHEWRVSCHTAGIIFSENRLPASLKNEAKMYYNAEKNIRSLIEKDADDKITAVFSDNAFFDGMIIYINGKPEYIIADGFNIPHYEDSLIPETPENIRKYFSEISFKDSEKKLHKLNYSDCIGAINTYLEYRRDPYEKYIVTSDDVKKYFSENKKELIKAVRTIPGITDTKGNIAVAISEPFKTNIEADNEYDGFNDQWYSVLFADGKASALLVFDIFPDKHLKETIPFPEELSGAVADGKKYSLLKNTLCYSTSEKNKDIALLITVEITYFAASQNKDKILIARDNVMDTEKINEKNNSIISRVSESDIICNDMPIIARYIYKRS